MKKIVSATLLVVVFGIAVIAQQAKQNVSVTATVEYGSGAIQAKLVPGEFTVPAGLKAVNLRVKKNTILMGNTSTSETRSDKDIYCVTTATYVPTTQTELPAGKYKFTVGGGPGSSGMLIYDLVQAK